MDGNYLDMVDKVRRATDIMLVVGDGPCPKCGGEVRAVPIHSVWHCFSCGIGGDVFAFIMARDGLSFSDAVKACAAGPDGQVGLFSRDTPGGRKQ